MLSDLREIRKWIDNLFYSTFDNITDDQRTMFKSILESIDQKIEDTQDF